MNITAQQLIAAFADSEFSLYTYSGRGMYGEQCVAFDAPSLAEGFSHVTRMLGSAEVPIEDIADLLEHAKHDSMGMDVVIYWPNLAWPKQPEMVKFQFYKEHPRKETITLRQSVEFAIKLIEAIPDVKSNPRLVEAHDWLVELYRQEGMSHLEGHEGLLETCTIFIRG